MKFSQSQIPEMFTWVASMQLLTSVSSGLSFSAFHAAVLRLLIVISSIFVVIWKEDWEELYLSKLMADVESSRETEPQVFNIYYNLYVLFGTHFFKRKWGDHASHHTYQYFRLTSHDSCLVLGQLYSSGLAEESTLGNRRACSTLGWEDPGRTCKPTPASWPGKNWRQKL